MDIVFLKKARNRAKANKLTGLEQMQAEKGLALEVSSGFVRSLYLWAFGFGSKKVACTNRPIRNILLRFFSRVTARAKRQSSRH